MLPAPPLQHRRRTLPWRVLAVAGIAFAWAQGGAAQASPASGEALPPGAAQPTQAPAPLPSVADMLKAAEAPSSAKPDAAAAPAIATDNAMTAQAPPAIIQVKSMFYSPDEIKRIHFAISAYVKRTTGHEQDMALDELNFLKQLTGMKVDKKDAGTGIAGLNIPGLTPAQPAKPVLTEYPQFYLESLAYHTPTDWSVSINHIKFTPSQPQSPNLQVVGISPDKVTVVWKPLLMDMVSDVWKRAPNDDVEVDTLHGTVTFTLRPNQTFSSYVMRVLEGKVVPKMVDKPVAQEAPPPIPLKKMIEQLPLPVDNGSDATKTDATPPPDAAKTDDNTGFYGLLNAYKNIK
jgi:hypothetical protein